MVEMGEQGLGECPSPDDSLHVWDRHKALGMMRSPMRPIEGTYGLMGVILTSL